tara:strand:+ start:431 stop:547 length:117 start_codon:yes stop_codon:yes gene_type:complete
MDEKISDIEDNLGALSPDNLGPLSPDKFGLDGTTLENK